MLGFLKRKENSNINIEYDLQRKLVREYEYRYYVLPTYNTQTYQLLAREHARELQSPFVRNLDIMSQ